MQHRSMTCLSLCRSLQACCRLTTPAACLLSYSLSLRWALPAITGTLQQPASNRSQLDRTPVSAWTRQIVGVTECIMARFTYRPPESLWLHNKIRSVIVVASHATCRRKCLSAFLQRVSVACYAERCTSYSKSVRPSVCLSHAVTCHPTRVNAPRLTPALQVGTRFTYPGGMEGWINIHIVDLIAPRSGVELATFRSRVRRPNIASLRQLLQPWEPNIFWQSLRQCST